MYPSNLMFVPKCIPIAEWPERHQAAWQLGFNKGGLFAKPTKASTWREASITKTKKALVAG